MKTTIFNKRLDFSAFLNKNNIPRPFRAGMLIKKLKDYFESYDEIYRDLNNLGTDYQISTIIDSSLFYSMF